MPTVYFCSDPHFSHKNIIKNLRSQFMTIEDHDNTIMDNINSKVGKNDTLQILGDVFFTQDAFHFFKNNIVCQNIHIIAGNHDNKFLKLAANSGYKLHGGRNYKGFWLTHIPIHPVELFGKINIHGHVHNNTIDDPRYINISMENIGYVPISLDQLREYATGNFDRKLPIDIHL